MLSSQNIDKAFEKVELKGMAIDSYISEKKSIKRCLADEELTYGYKQVGLDDSLTKKLCHLQYLEEFRG